MTLNRILISAFVLALGCAAVKPAAASQEAAYRYNSQGLVKLKTGNYKGAIEDLKTAHRYLPASKKITKNLAVAYNNYAFHLMRKGDVNRAIEQFENALYYDKENPYTLYNIGQAYYRTQDMSRARDYLEEAYAINPRIKGLKDLLEKAGRETAVEEGFDRIETMHFIVAAARDVPVNKTSYIRTYLEEAYGRVGMFLDHYPKQRTVAVLFSEDNYDKLLNNMPHWTLALYDGKVRIPVNRFKYTDEEIIKIIYHEYAHVVVRDITRGNCPMWLNEGIAGIAEGFAEPKEKHAFGRYIERYGIIPLWSMPEDFSVVRNRDIVTLLYMESYLLVEFIIKRSGRTGLRKLLMYLGKGADIRSALAAVTGMDIPQFEKAWEKYVSLEYGIRDMKYYK